MELKMYENWPTLMGIFPKVIRPTLLITFILT